MNCLYVINIIILLFGNRTSYCELKNDETLKQFFNFSFDPELCIYTKENTECIQRGTYTMEYVASNKKSVVKVVISFYDEKPFIGDITITNYDAKKIVDLFISQGFWYEYEEEFDEISKIEKYFFIEDKFKLIIINDELCDFEAGENLETSNNMISISIENPEYNSLFQFHGLRIDIKKILELEKIMEKN